MKLILSFKYMKAVYRAFLLLMKLLLVFPDLFGLLGASISRSTSGHNKVSWNFLYFLLTLFGGWVRKKKPGTWLGRKKLSAINGWVKYF